MTRRLEKWQIVLAATVLAAPASLTAEELKLVCEGSAKYVRIDPLKLNGGDVDKVINSTIGVWLDLERPSANSATKVEVTCPRFFGPFKA